MWGLYWIPLKQLDAMGIPSSLGAALLSVPAAIALLLVILQRGFKLSGQSLAIGFATGAAVACYGGSLETTSVVKATLLFYLTPVWSTLLGRYWLGEPINWQRWLAIVVGLAGCGLLVASPGQGGFNSGDAMALTAGVLWSVGACLIKLNPGLPLAVTTFTQCFWAALIGTGLSWALHPQMATTSSEIQAALPLLLGVSLLAMLPAIALLFWAQRYISPGKVGLLMMSEVLVAVLSASLLVPEEQLSASEWLGALLVITACVLEVVPVKRKSPLAAEAS